MTTSGFRRHRAFQVILPDGFLNIDHDFLIARSIRTYYQGCIVSEITRFYCKPHMTNIGPLPVIIPQMVASHHYQPSTRTLNIGSGPQPSPVDIHGNTLESTDCFTYPHGQSITLICPFYHWDIKKDRYCLECDGSPIQCLATVEVESPYKNTASQCSGKVSPTIWCRNMDNAEIRRAENRGLPHVLLAPHSRDTLVWLYLEVVDRTHGESIAAQVQRRRLALFGHVRRLSDTVPANAALRLYIDARVGRRVDVLHAWKRQRGRPRNTWSAK